MFFIAGGILWASIHSRHR